MAETIVLDFQVDVEDSIVSIKKLTDANKALREERKNLNISSVEGKKRIDEINATIDKNTATIKTNVSAIEQQKINIGNYKSALDGIAPGLGKFAEGLQAGTKGFKAMTAQALAFIATPIGLVIAAIGAALFALTSYFKGSEEGQNNLNKVVAVGSAIFEQFMNIVEAVGKIIFDAISNPKQALIDFGNLVKENIINRFVGLLEFLPAIGTAIGLLFEGKFAEAGQVAFDAVAKVTVGVADATSKIAGFIDSTGKLIEVGKSNGEKLAALQAKIAKDERALTELRSKNDLEVSKLREQAVNLEGAAKRKAIQEAIALEEALSKKEVEFAKTKSALASLEVVANGDTIEALKAESEAVAAVADAEKTAFSNTLKFRKELSGLDKDRAEDIKKQNEALFTQSELERELRIAKLDKDLAGEPDNNPFATEAKLSKNLGKDIQKDLNERQKALDKYYKDKNDKAAKSAEFEADLEARKFAIIMDLSGSLAGLMKEDSEAQRAITSAMALVNTYAAAVAAFKSGSEINVFFGVAAAAAAVAAGLANVARINNVEFAEGGWTGPGSKMQAVGVVHADEYVTPKWIVNSPKAQPHLAALEGMRRGSYFDGGLVSNSISNPINQAFEISNMLKNMPAPVVSVKEINRGQKAVRVKQNISKR